MDFFDTSFWQNFLSNALATFFGAIIGIPIALGLGRHQEKASEKERKKKLLSLLREELLVNLTQLSGSNKAKDKRAEAVIIEPFLRNEKTYPVDIDFLWAMVEKGINESTEMVTLALKAISKEETTN